MRDEKQGRFTILDDMQACRLDKKTTSRNLSNNLAAEEGFEPSHTESESAVLPLHNSAIFRTS